jgi:hypothetical protein
VILDHYWRYDLQYAVVVEDPVNHRDSGLGTLSLLDAKRESDRAYGKGPRLVEITGDLIERDLAFVGMALKLERKGLTSLLPTNRT